MLGLSIVGLPIVLESPHIDSVGAYWQGRYWLPLAIGVPLVASAVCEGSKFFHTANS